MIDRHGAIVLEAAASAAVKIYEAGQECAVLQEASGGGAWLLDEMV